MNTSVDVIQAVLDPWLEQPQMAPLPKINTRQATNASKNQRLRVIQ